MMQLKCSILRKRSNHFERPVVSESELLRHMTWIRKMKILPSKNKGCISISRIVHLGQRCETFKI